MKQENMDRISAFNRYYTKILGVLNKRYLGNEFGFPKGYAELSKFHFRPELKGKGAGKRLLKLVEARATKAGYMYIVSYPPVRKRRRHA